MVDGEYIKGNIIPIPSRKAKTVEIIATIS
jgi:hypothetical protein